MKIACLGWGSLIWKPQELRVEGSWKDDGVELPIEFTRISNNGRVTLIIDKESEDVVTLWNRMGLDDLNQAIANLCDREGTPIDKIHHVTKTSSLDDPIQRKIVDWLATKDLDAAIWTGLSYSQKTKFKRPSVDQIIEHLTALKGQTLVDAKEYVQKTPKQIDTIYRKEIVKKLDWI